jgi:hypothetical protein
MGVRLHFTIPLFLTIAHAACGSDVGNDMPHSGVAGDNSVTTTSGPQAGSGGSAGGSSVPDASGGAASDARAEQTPESASDDFGAEAGATIANLLGAQSMDCLACAQASCGQYITGCATLSGNAKEGPAAGERRAALCIETLACVLPTSCARLSMAACYCGFAHPDPKFNCDLDSPCSRVLERSLETTDPLTVLATMSDSTKGGGWAMNLMQCLRDNQCVACMPAPPDDGGTEAGSDDAANGGASFSAVGIATEKSLNRHTHQVIGKRHGNL